MDWAERKTFYDQEFFTKKCPFASDSSLLHQNTANFASWLFAKSGNPATYLDCGCSAGGLVFAFSKLDGVSDAYGFDLAEYAVSRAIPEVKERIMLLDCATEAIPFPDQYFELCTAIDFFEHQDDQHIEMVVGEITRVTKGCLFLRQPFTKFNMPVDNRGQFLIGLNQMTHVERLKLIDGIPEVTTSVPDQNCPYHPQERGRDFFLELFSKYHFEEQGLEEDDYKYPNAGSVCSFNTLFLQRVGAS